MKVKITLLFVLVVSLLKAQETTIIFNAPLSTPTDGKVTLRVYTALEYEPGHWLGFGDEYDGTEYTPHEYELTNNGNGVFSITDASAVFGRDAAGWQSNYVGMRFYLNDDYSNLAMFRNDGGDLFTDQWPSYRNIYDDAGELVGNGDVEGQTVEFFAEMWTNEAQSYEVVYNVTVPDNTPEDLVVYIWGAKFGYGLNESNLMTKKEDNIWTLTTSYYEQPTAYYTYVMNYHYNEIMDGDLTYGERYEDEYDQRAVDRIVPSGPAVLNDGVLRWDGFDYDESVTEIGNIDGETSVKTIHDENINITVNGNRIEVGTNQAVNLSLYNFIGQRIIETNATAIENIPTGYYIVKAIINTNSYSQKIIIK